MEGKNILVTGGAGFIGSNLVKRLVSLGANVTVTVKYNSIIDNVRLASIWDDINVIESDLRNVDSLKQFSSISYDIVYHLAAYNHVGDSFVHVIETINSNILATVNIFEFGPDWNRFVYTASSEVYGYQNKVPFDEVKSVPFPISPYSVGKYAGEMYAKMKQYQMNKEVVCLRPFNTFGPYQSERAIIPEIIFKCLRGDLIKTTEGKQTREFNFVENIVDAFILSGEKAYPGAEPINIGSGCEIAIRDLVKTIHSLTDSESELQIGALPNRPTEIWRMSAANARAREKLEWSPVISFEEGLNKTIEWFRKYRDVYFGENSLSTL